MRIIYKENEMKVNEVDIDVAIRTASEKEMQNKENIDCAALNVEEILRNHNGSEDSGILIDDVISYSSKLQTMTVSDILTLIKNKALVLDPPYQRGRVWDTQLKSKLIESIFIGFPVPPLILAKVGTTYRVIDGKQRISTIRDFINGSSPDSHGDFILSFKTSGPNVENVELKKRLHGKTYSDLHLNSQTIINNYKFYCYVIDSTDSGVKEPLMYDRINTSGKTLSSSEVLKSRFCYSRFYTVSLKGILNSENCEAGGDAFAWCINSPTDRGTEKSNIKGNYRGRYESYITSLAICLVGGPGNDRTRYTNSTNNKDTVLRNISSWNDKEVDLLAYKIKRVFEIARTLYQAYNMDESLTLDLEGKDQLKPFRKRTVRNYQRNPKAIEKLVAIIGAALWELEKEKTGLLTNKAFCRYIVSKLEELSTESDNNKWMLNIKNSCGLDQKGETYLYEVPLKLIKDCIVQGKAVYGNRYFSDDMKTTKWNDTIKDGRVTCTICGKDLTLKTAVGDHILPWSKGGKTTIDNLQLTCEKCNKEKGCNL